jgi:hypothetical protein
MNIFGLRWFKDGSASKKKLGGKTKVTIQSFLVTMRGEQVKKL